MNKFEKNLDNMISKILQEEIESRSNQLAEKVETGEWVEIDTKESLKGNQKKLDVAEPKGKIGRAHV